MKAIRCMLAPCAVLMVSFVANAATITFPAASGDLVLNVARGICVSFR